MDLIGKYLAMTLNTDEVEHDNISINKQAHNTNSGCCLSNRMKRILCVLNMSNVIAAAAVVAVAPAGWSHCMMCTYCVCVVCVRPHQANFRKG